MKKTLLRKYIDGSSLVVFSCDEMNMDKFIIENFDTEEEMEDYFDEMKTVKISDCIIDRGKFHLLSTNDDGLVSEEKIIYGEDYKIFKEKVLNDLINSDNYLRFLLKKCPKLFPGSLHERFEVSLSNRSTPLIHTMNVNTFKNYLIEGALIDNFRSIYTLTNQFEKITTDKKVLVKKMEI